MEEDRFERRSYAPVKVGDELEIEIEAVGEKGDGLAKKDGFVLFVPGVQAGDKVKVKVTRVLRKVGFAEVVNGEASSDASQEEGQEEEGEEVTENQTEESTAEEPQDAAEDSEDFGEELDKQE
jgi:predicted RNA-binding protein with TRAM domain